MRLAVLIGDPADQQPCLKEAMFYYQGRTLARTPAPQPAELLISAGEDNNLAAWRVIPNEGDGRAVLCPLRHRWSVRTPVRGDDLRQGHSSIVASFREQRVAALPQPSLEFDGVCQTHKGMRAALVLSFTTVYWNHERSRARSSLDG